METHKKELKNQEDALEKLEETIGDIELNVAIDGNYEEVLEKIKKMENEEPLLKKVPSLKNMKNRIKRHWKKIQMIDFILDGDFSFEKIRSNILNTRNSKEIVWAWINKIDDFALEEFIEEIQKLLDDLEKDNKRHYSFSVFKIIEILNAQKIDHEFRVKNLLINPKKWIHPSKTAWFKKEISLIKKENPEKEYFNFFKDFFTFYIYKKYIFDKEKILKKYEKN